MNENSEQSNFNLKQNIFYTSLTILGLTAWYVLTYYSKELDFTVKAILYSFASLIITTTFCSSLYVVIRLVYGLLSMGHDLAMMKHAELLSQAEREKLIAEKMAIRGEVVMQLLTPGQSLVTGNLNNLSLVTAPMTPLAVKPGHALFSGNGYNLGYVPPLPIASSQNGEQIAGAVATLPNSILLSDLLPSEGASLKRIVLGVTVANNQLKPLTIDLDNFVHGAIGGASGWGKSVLGRVIGYQLAACPEKCELAFIDIEGVTFPVFAKSAKLRYPLCDTIAGAVAIARDLIGELNRRKALFANYPLVDKLSEYNAVATDALAPIALLVDESTTLFKQSPDFETNITELALRARKYGIYLILLGQDFKQDTLSTTIRNQLSSRIQLKAQDGTQSRTLLGYPIAKDITRPGQAYAILPGQPMVELQTPYLSKQEAMKVPSFAESPAIPKSIFGLPVAPSQEPGQELSERERKVLELREAGKSWNEIAKKVIGSAGGAQSKAVQDYYESAKKKVSISV